MTGLLARDDAIGAPLFLFCDLNFFWGGTGGKKKADGRKGAMPRNAVDKLLFILDVQGPQVNEGWGMDGISSGNWTELRSVSVSDPEMVDKTE